MTMRVAMLSEHASPLALLGGVDAGGQNVYIDAVSRELAALGCTVDVFTRRDDPARPQSVPWADGVQVIHVPAGPECWLPKDDLWPHMPAFRDGIDRFARLGPQYDVIHGNFWMSGWVAAELAACWQTPVAQIFHATGMTKRREQGGADTSPDGRIAVEREVVQRVDRMIAQCPAERDELIDDYDARPERISLIPSAVDTTRFRPIPRTLARRQLGLVADDKIVVYVGRMVPRKDARNIVQALAMIAQRRREAGRRDLPRLYLVGGETETPDPIATPEIGVLRDLTEALGLSDVVTFVGRRQPDDLHRWYSAADVAVTTPWYEPFGLTPLEAMACGCPVIGADVGGISFTIADGETGFLVPAKDPAALADRLETLLADPARRERMGRAGRARVEREFTWPTVARRTMALYADLLWERSGINTELDDIRTIRVTARSVPVAPIPASA
ncbi:MAG: glycosyltransferase [Thermomicrobiales bacterium]